MVPFTHHEAESRSDHAWAAIQLSKQGSKDRGPPDLVDAQVHQAVLDWLSATEDLIVSYQKYLQQKAHDEEMLSEDDAEGLAKMLAGIADKFFPEAGRTIVDDANSPEARVIRLTPSSVKLRKFQSALADSRHEVNILVDWFDWFGREAAHGHPGMFADIRHIHDLTKVFTRCLDKVATAYRKICEGAMQS